MNPRQLQVCLGVAAGLLGLGLFAPCMTLHPAFGEITPLVRLLKPDLTAPGTHIRSALAGGGDAGVSKTGTSMAAPHVAGVVALLRQARAEWTPKEIKACLLNTAQAEIYGSGGHPEEGGSGLPVAMTRQGAGRVQIASALETTLLAYAGGEGVVAT